MPTADAGETVIRVPLAAQGGDLAIGQPEPLFETPPSTWESAFGHYDYDPIRDRFLFSQPPRGADERREIALSLGWTGRLRSRLCTPSSRRPWPGLSSRVHPPQESVDLFWTGA